MIGPAAFVPPIHKLDSYKNRQMLGRVYDNGQAIVLLPQMNRIENKNQNQPAGNSVVRFDKGIDQLFMDSMKLPANQGNSLNGQGQQNQFNNGWNG